MAKIKDLKRMCNSHPKCENCPMLMYQCAPGDLPDNVDEIVDKWVAEHPVNTYAMDFFEKFPNAPRDSDGVPKSCWKYVYGDGTYCSSNDCTKCWNREVE